VRAFVLGLCGVHGLFLLAPVALALAAAELSAIAAGEAPAGGKNFARAALVMGIAGVLMPASIALAWLLTRGS
jgi:hypothetical protein